MSAPAITRSYRRTGPPAPVPPGARKCLRCPYPLVPCDRNPPPGWRLHCARGLCYPCYQRARLMGELLDVERLTHTRDEVLDEWVWLRSIGVDRQMAARQLGMTFAAFDRALQRARAAGDPRASSS